jgi:SOS-response transcriptional repressor LexA
MGTYEDVAQKAWQAVLKKVQHLEKSGVKPVEISRMLSHKGRSTVSNWLNGVATAENASFADMLRYLDVLNIDLYDFIPPKKLPQIAHPGQPPEPIHGENLQTVKVYDVAGAGPAVLFSDIEPLFSVTAPPEYFFKSDFALKVSGHSMEPLIPHEAIVGIKTGLEFLANEIYAARIPYEGLVIKRVGVDMETKEFVFKSQNPDKEAYPDFRLCINEAENIIVGRVVWVMYSY